MNEFSKEIIVKTQTILLVKDFNENGDPYTEIIFQLPGSKKLNKAHVVHYSEQGQIDFFNKPDKAFISKTISDVKKLNKK